MPISIPPVFGRPVLPGREPALISDQFENQSSAPHHRMGGLPDDIGAFYFILMVETSSERSLRGRQAVRPEAGAKSRGWGSLGI